MVRLRNGTGGNHGGGHLRERAAGEGSRCPTGVRVRVPFARTALCSPTRGWWCPDVLQDRRFSRSWSVALALMVASGLFVVVTFDPSGSSVRRCSCLRVRFAGRAAGLPREVPARLHEEPMEVKVSGVGGSLQLSHPHPYPCTHAQVELAATSAPRMAKPISSEPHMVHAAESATARCTHANCKVGLGLRWLWGAPLHV